LVRLDQLVRKERSVQPARLVHKVVRELLDPPDLLGFKERSDLLVLLALLAQRAHREQSAKLVLPDLPDLLVRRKRKAV